MSSISSLFSHVDWRNKGEVSMVMPVTSSLPEGLGIVPIVLHKRRRKEGQSRRKSACHSSPVIYNCAVVYKCLTQSLSIYREKWEQMLSLCLCVGKLVTWRTRWIISHTFSTDVTQHSGELSAKCLEKGATRFGRCESLPSHPVDQSELLPAGYRSDLLRVSSTFGQLIVVFHVTLAGSKTLLSTERSIRSIFYFPLKLQTPSNSNLTATLQHPH